VTVADGTVYFGTSDSGMFHALDAKNGTPVFSLLFHGWAAMFSSPAIAGNMVYLGSHSGWLFAIDRTTQKQAWEFQTDASKQNGHTYTKTDGTPKYEAAFVSDFYDDIIVGVAKRASRTAAPASHRPALSRCAAGQ